MQDRSHMSLKEFQEMPKSKNITSFHHASRVQLGFFSSVSVCAVPANGGELKTFEISCLAQAFDCGHYEPCKINF